MRSCYGLWTTGKFILSFQHSVRVSRLRHVIDGYYGPGGTGSVFVDDAVAIVRRKETISGRQGRDGSKEQQARSSFEALGEKNPFFH